MGLLSDPSLNRRNQLGRSLIKHNRKLCSLFYIAGIAWFCCLGLPDFNHATYFSENALSPGLVFSEIKSDSAKYAQQLLDELNREREIHSSSIPYAWISAKMKQIGLDTFTHNFTLNYPLGGGKIYQGRNIYGILRAPRIASTEGIVLSAPYRYPNSVHTEITASIPLLLAFAEFARKKNYWAKDIIFLVTDQEQLGMHAWLQAYYKEDMEDSSILDAGSLEGRSGALQAALNLEIQDFDIDHIQVKVEGLNGQLPNLDMFNLVQRLAGRENFPSSYKPSRNVRRSNFPTVKDNIMHMLSMILNQATCVPTGNHGLFHRYRIESLTLDGVKRVKTNPHNRQMRAAAFLRTIEGIFRSLNNLLERFHQSYFFYLLVASDRFVSIGDFMPCLVLMVGPLIVKAFLLWLSLDDDGDKEKSKNDQQEDTDKEKDEKSGTNPDNEQKGEENESLSKEDEETESVDATNGLNERKSLDIQYLTVGTIIGIAMLLGFAACFLPANRGINAFLSAYEYKTETIISAVLLAITIVAIITPIFSKLNPNGLELLHIATLLYLGCSLIVVGLLNFSLGFIIATAVAPLAIILDTKRGLRFRSFIMVYTVLLQPFVVSYLTVFIMTLKAFPEFSLQEVAVRAVAATMDAITFSVVDSIIYGNWLFTVGTAVLFPAWILIWNIIWSKRSEEAASEKLKQE